MTQYDSGAPTVLVRVYADRELVARVLCETSEEAVDVAATWEDRPGYMCIIEDLGEVHEPDAVLAPEPEDLDPENEYRTR